jgi:general secretion pathway protein G
MPANRKRTKKKTRPGAKKTAARFVKTAKNARDKKTAGFTLIEIMVAAMILLILISVAGFVVTRNIGKAKVISAKNQIQIFSMALNSYFLDSGQYPSTEQGLAALWEKPVLEPVPEGWDGPYLDKFVPDDPWGRAYEYTSPGPHGLPFGIRSFGADGLEGGEGADQDIASWQK